MILGVSVPVAASPALPDDTVTRALTSSLFREWAASLDASFAVSRVEVQSVDFFGPRVGFLKLLATATRGGLPVPGVVFLRGGAVAVLPILSCRGARFVVCCRQPRLAVGAGAFLEIPAGMLDGSGRFASVAAAEMREETGIEMHESALVDLTALAFAGAAPGVFPSVGACDEFLRLLLWERECDEPYLHALRGRLAGNRDEHEAIVVELVAYDDLWRAAPDAKTLAAVLLYERCRAAGLLPQPSHDAAEVLTVGGALATAAEAPRGAV